MSKLLNVCFRFREDEVKAEMAEREVQKLQKEVDKLEVMGDIQGQNVLYLRKINFNFEV